MTDGDDAPELTMDTAFDLLSNSRRRFTLYYLSRKDGEVPLNEIAAQIAAWENDVDVDDLSDAQQKRTYVSLYQTHFPKLTEFGVIRFDRDRSVVELTGKAQELEAYLPGTRTTRPWPAYYAGYSVAAAVVYALAVFDVTGFGLAADPVVGGLIIVGIAALSVGHYAVESRARSDGLSRLVQ